MVSVVLLVVDSGDAAGLAAGVTVSVFCSQAARSAAPAKMQIYFFIILSRDVDTQLNRTSEQDDISDVRIALNRRRVFHSMRVGHCLTCQSSIASIDPAKQRRLLFAGLFQSEVGQEFDITVSDVR